MNKVFKTASTLAIGSSLLLGTAVVADPVDAATKSVKPYYNYKGYVKNNSKFVLDKDFVRALNHDNIKINGYKLNLKGKTGAVQNFMKYDTYYNKDTKNRITMIRPVISGKKQVTLKAFLKAHKANKLVSKGKGEKPNTYQLHYKTKGKADYFVLFNKGYLSYFEYAVSEK